MSEAVPRVASRRWLWLGLYLCLLAASQIRTALQAEPALPTPGGSERVSLGVGENALSALRWEPESPVEGALPILLLHGSPGDASNFGHLGARLARDGREVIALDLPGFGGSASVPGGRSILDHARASLAAVPWSSFHVATWSMGGGVGLHMADLAPDRVRSLAQIAAIGVQEGEGSGSYVFEHVKYAFMWALVVPGVELLPHFGLFGTRKERSGFCLNFWESDQRPLRAILASVKTPMLIAQGRKDFLVPMWCAEESHRLAAHSRLVIFEGSHFLPFPPPFGQLDQLAPELETFLARHDVAGSIEPHAESNLSNPLQMSLPEAWWLPRHVPWWIAFACCALLASWRAGWCGVVVGSLAAMLQLDLGLGLIAGALGAGARACSRAGSKWKAWLVDVARLVGAIVASSVFATKAGDGLCDLAGPWGGVLLAILLQFLGLVVLGRLVQALRNWRAQRRSGRTAAS
ncbi:MAG TPA: alpha/beta fold hydrolase [Planctomycetota bacterium]|nr:alpha/beta fold hydrolase [Planctomycetota bacterium]